jgi:hypothetical protein
MNKSALIIGRCPRQGHDIVTLCVQRKPRPPGHTPFQLGILQRTDQALPLRTIQILCGFFLQHGSPALDHRLKGTANQGA